MTTLTQIVYNILNLARGGRSTNSELIPLDQIKYQIKYYRALLLRRSKERLNRVKANAQTIDVPFQTTTETWATSGQTIPDMSANTPATVARSVDRIPRIAEFKLMPAIMSARIENSMVAVPYQEDDRAIWQQFNKYTSGSRLCWLSDGYLWVSNWDTTGGGNPVVTLTAIFEDPEQAYNFNLGGSSPWDDDINEFPITADLLQQITQSAMNGEMQIFRSTPVDTVLDNQPDQQVSQ